MLGRRQRWWRGQEPGRLRGHCVLSLPDPGHSDGSTAAKGASAGNPWGVCAPWQSKVLVARCAARGQKKPRSLPWSSHQHCPGEHPAAPTNLCSLHLPECVSLPRNTGNELAWRKGEGPGSLSALLGQPSWLPRTWHRQLPCPTHSGTLQGPLPKGGLEVPLEMAEGGKKAPSELDAFSQRLNSFFQGNQQLFPFPAPVVSGDRQGTAQPGAWRGTSKCTQAAKRAWEEFISCALAPVCTFLAQLIYISTQIPQRATCGGLRQLLKEGVWSCFNLRVVCLAFSLQSLGTL